MTRITLVALCSLVLACGDDDGGVDAATMDSGGEDASTGDAGSDAAEDDAAMDDAAMDDAAMDDAGECACIDQTLMWEWDGGLTFADDSSEVVACRDFNFTRDLRDGEPLTCTNEVPCLGDAITIDDVRGALENAEVVAAFEAAPIVYGVDARPVDAPLFVVTYGGDAVQIGMPCGGASGCNEIPEGLVALRTLLQSLQVERLAEEPCASTITDL